MPNDYIKHRQKCAQIEDPVEKKKCLESYVKKGSDKSRKQVYKKPLPQQSIDEDLKDLETVVNNAFIYLENKINELNSALNKRITNLEELPGNRNAKIKSIGLELTPSQLRQSSTTLKGTKTRGLAKGPSIHEIERGYSKYMLGRMKPTKTRVAKNKPIGIELTPGKTTYF